MRSLTLQVVTALVAVVGWTAGAHAVDLEVVVHNETPSGKGLAGLDLLLCSDGPCTAAATTDRKGRAVFPGLEAGDVTVRAVPVPCGPFDWPVTLDSASATQRIDVVVPATGGLRVQVSRVEADDTTKPLAGTDVRFLINGSSASPSYPSQLSAGTRTDSEGVGEMCFPAGSEFNVTVEVAGYQVAALPKQKIAAGEVATARIALRPDRKP